MMKKLAVVERFTDNGESSHWDLIDSEKGDVLGWGKSEDSIINDIIEDHRGLMILCRDTLPDLGKYDYTPAFHVYSHSTGIIMATYNGKEWKRADGTIIENVVSWIHLSTPY